MDLKVINGIRSLSIDMIEEARSGHPGICLGAAPIIYTLFAYHLNYNTSEGNWLNRDRFILSAGHGSALLYSTLFYVGYPIKFDELKTFRQINSRLTGHPELNTEIGIETTTGPLGEGLATSVGMAIAEEYLSNNINKDIFNHYTYCLVSDGDLMEGRSYEAASLAGSLKLSKLILLYDSNNVSLDGPTNNIFNDNIKLRFESMGWHYELVNDSEDIVSISKAIIKAQTVTDKPSIIEVKTKIGYGSKLEGNNLVHGTPLTEDDIQSLKTKLGMKKVPFYISKDAALFIREKVSTRTKAVYSSWVKKYNEFISTDSVLKKSLANVVNNDFKIDLSKIKINFEKGYTEELRETNGKIISLLGEVSPLHLTATPDVASSTKVVMPKSKSFKVTGEYGKNIRMGVRESIMPSVLNGLALCNLRPISGCFLTFSDYMKPGIRLSSMMKLPITYVFTHDSILIGEDGPTHQPIEQIGTLRSIPNMLVFRPSDVREVIGSWNFIVNNNITSSLVLTKESLPELQNSKLASIEQGAYIIEEERGRLSGIIVATGHDVHTAVAISKSLNRKGIYARVISMPCVELYNMQKDTYKKTLFPTGAKVIVIESSNDNIWHSFVYNSKYLLNVREFGSSGKKEDVMKKYNMDISTLTSKVEELLK